MCLVFLCQLSQAVCDLRNCKRERGTMLLHKGYYQLQQEVWRNMGVGNTYGLGTFHYQSICMCLSVCVCFVPATTFCPWCCSVMYGNTNAVNLDGLFRTQIQNKLLPSVIHQSQFLSVLSGQRLSESRHDTSNRLCFNGFNTLALATEAY